MFIDQVGQSEMRRGYVKRKTTRGMMAITYLSATERERTGDRLLNRGTAGLLLSRGIQAHLIVVCVPSILRVVCVRSA